MDLEECYDFNDNEYIICAQCGKVKYLPASLRADYALKVKSYYINDNCPVYFDKISCMEKFKKEHNIKFKKSVW